MKFDYCEPIKILSFKNLLINQCSFHLETETVKLVNSLKISAIVSPDYLDSLCHYSTSVLMSLGIPSYQTMEASIKALVM